MALGALQDRVSRVICPKDCHPGAISSESDMECGDLSLHSKRPSSAVPRVKTRLDLKLTNDK